LRRSCPSRSRGRPAKRGRTSRARGGAIVLGRGISRRQGGGGNKREKCIFHRKTEGEDRRKAVKEDRAESSRPLRRKQQLKDLLGTSNGRRRVGTSSRTLCEVQTQKGGKHIPEKRKGETGGRTSLRPDACAKGETENPFLES